MPNEIRITIRSRIILFYSLLLLFHVAHVTEEMFGRFRIFNKIGLGWFISVNAVLFSIPVLLFIFVMKQRRWAFKLGIIYAAIMGLQGIGHNILTLATGDYYDGYAGGYSGLGLLLISIPLIYYLQKGMPPAGSGPENIANG